MAVIEIVVPCYNEADRLPADRFADFCSTNPEIAFVFVDDGSTDATYEMLTTTVGRCGDGAGVLRLSENAGKAEAVRQGLLDAFTRGPKVVGFWDADLATPLEAIEPMARLVIEDPEVEAVFGSRIRMLGRDVDRDPMRHYAGRVFATVVSLMLQVPIYDSQCGAKVFRASTEIEELFSEEFVSKWIFDVEILARFRQRLGPEAWAMAGETIHEFPLNEWHDVSGSKLKSSDFARSFSDLAKIYQKYIAT